MQYAVNTFLLHVFIVYCKCKHDEDLTNNEEDIMHFEATMMMMSAKNEGITKMGIQNQLSWDRISEPALTGT